MGLNREKGAYGNFLPRQGGVGAHQREGAYLRGGSRGLRYDLRYPKETNFRKVKTYKEMAKKALKKVANLATTANYKRNFLLQKKKNTSKQISICPRSLLPVVAYWSHTCSLTSSGIESVVGVSMKPGKTVLYLTPNLCHIMEKKAQIVQI